MSNKQFIPPIVGHINAILRKIDPRIEVKELYKDSAIFGLVNGTGFKFIQEDERTIGINPLKVAETAFWYSITLEYNRTIKKTKNISIGVYDDQQTKKLFRAEWSINEAESFHAQPHWHFTTTEILSSSEPNEWRANEEIQSFFPNESSSFLSHKLSHLHFAMCANWFESSSNHISEIDENCMVNWVKNVMKYIQYQILYLYDKQAAKVLWAN
jgi:hypothetical protein